MWAAAGWRHKRLIPSDGSSISQGKETSQKEIGIPHEFHPVQGDDNEATAEIHDFLVHLGIANKTEGWAQPYCLKRGSAKGAAAAFPPCD